MKGTRADVRLVEQGLAASRERARAMIMAGTVYLQEVRIDKPGENVAPDSVLSVRGESNPFVSRGGLKLQKALQQGGLALSGAVALDVGASTGGLTDCMLRYGAKKVYAIDVGYGQLDWRLRNDARVVVMERTNARDMRADWFAETPDFASVDVSFISIRLILPNLYTCLGENGQVVALVKPQFEAGRGLVGKNGVVREKRTHITVLAEAVEFARKLGFRVMGAEYSPIKGPKGNIEFLLTLGKSCADMDAEAEEIARAVVEAAHAALHRDAGNE